MRASDGHELDSKWEVIVDDALYANGLIHAPHPRYPGTQLIADFLVGDVYVEVWEMKSQKYLAQREVKERLAREMKLKLVAYTLVRALRSHVRRALHFTLAARVCPTPGQRS